MQSSFTCFTVRVKSLLAVFGGVSESVTWAVKLKDPSVVGLPNILPEDELRLNPGGRLPHSIDQT